MSTDRCKRCTSDPNYSHIRAEKGLAEDVDYSIDYAKTFDLVSPADTISSSSWAVSSNGTLGAISTSGTIASAFVSGGTKIGEVIRLTNTMITAGARTHVRVILIKIVNRLAEVPAVAAATIP